MSGLPFPDHFSGVAASYAAARPDYPDALFRALRDLAPDREFAWDCATGNGQAACGLANHFAAVLATDASREQIARARRDPRIHYAVALGESAPLTSRSVALVTVAQALHWLDVDRFYGEARRVLARRGIIAVWAYHLATITPDIDSLILRFYSDTVGKYWPAERRHIETGYRELPFPFERVPMPPLTIDREMTAAQFLAYLRTWSAVQRYTQAHGSDPVLRIEPRLVSEWGPATLEVSWPLHLLVGRVSP